MGLLLSALTGPLIAGIGGILGTIASGILICCGPPHEGGGAGKMQACMVLCAIGALCEIAGAAVGVALFFGWKADIEEGCGVAVYGAAYSQACVDLAVGLVGSLVWPSTGVSIVAGVLMVVCAMKCKVAMAALSGKTQGVISAVGAA